VGRITRLVRARVRCKIFVVTVCLTVIKHVILIDCDETVFVRFILLFA